MENLLSGRLDFQRLKSSMHKIKLVSYSFTTIKRTPSLQRTTAPMSAIFRSSLLIKNTLTKESLADYQCCSYTLRIVKAYYVIGYGNRAYLTQHFAVQAIGISHSYMIAYISPAPSCTVALV